MKKKAVVIGYGGQGGWHVRQILQSDVVELCGIYDIDPYRSSLARSLGLRAFGTLEDALASDADIVVIATPNDSHFEIAKAALEAHKNVICEKPAEMSAKAVGDMIDMSEKNGCLFTVHHNRRWDVDYLGMQSIIGSKDIGAPIRIESRVFGSRGIPSDWRGKAACGGGMVYDWGVHLIDQMLLLIPEKITGVYCELTHITNKEVDDGFRITINFEGGASGYVEVGTYNFIPLPRFYMVAEKGSAIITDWTENARVVKCKHWTENDALPVQTAAGITKTMAPRDEVTVNTYEVPRPISDVHDFYRNFCAAIDGRESLIVTHRQILRNFAVMEAAFESAKTGRVVPLSV